MRRISAFFIWQERWWDTRGEDLPSLSPQQREGVHAYAKRQAALRRSLRIRFEFQWKDLDDLVRDGDARIALMREDAVGHPDSLRDVVETV